MTLMRTLARSYRPSTCTLRAVVVTTIFLVASAAANAESLPFKYLGGLESRWNAAEFVCTATVSEIVPSGKLPVIDGTTVREYLVTAYADRVFKGDWTQQGITFRSYGLNTTGGIVSYIGPPLADFKVNSRYLLFLRNRTAPEVVTPVFETAIRLAGVGEANQYEKVVPEGVSADKTALVAEMIAAIYAEPSQLLYSTPYFGEISGLLGKTDAVHVFESFYGSDDPVVRVAAAKMVASPYSQDGAANGRAAKVLLAVAAEPSAPDFTRADAALRLAEMRVTEVRPYAESIVLKAEDASAREFALRGLEHIGTRSSEAALVSALDDSTMTNQFLAAYTLQQIECGTSLDETMFKKQPDRIVGSWKLYAKQPSLPSPCKSLSGTRGHVDTH